MNKITGEIFEVDPREARIKRLRRRVWAWCKAMEAYRKAAKERVVVKMVTLTYRHVDQWRPNHIRSFMLVVRRFFAGRLRGYCWVAELQKRGAVHYHVLIAHANGKRMPYLDKAGWWTHGMTRVETVKHLLYVMKYTQKGSDDTNSYPHNARTFATWLPRDVEIPSAEYRNWRISAYPKWVGDRLRDIDGVGLARPSRFGGWIIGGEVISSPYKFLGV